jgi:beta-glucosidase
MVEAARGEGLNPMVTLHHFTVPRWFAERGGFQSAEAPMLFDRYVRTVVTALGEGVDHYCTINEPGMLAMGGYLGAFGWPPGTRDLDSWHRAINQLRLCHVAGRDAVKEVQPEARVGLAQAMVEYEANPAGRPMMEYLRRFNEDVFFEVCEPDDFIGVQAYTRVLVEPRSWTGPFIGALMGTPPLRRALVPSIIRRTTGHSAGVTPGNNPVRRTDMGYEYRPQAVAASVRRAAQMLPGKDIIVTEHGIATTDDRERIEFITEALTALHATVQDGVPLQGYIHWSAFDNFEWAFGYRMQFGLIAVDRSTQERTPKPSASFLGAVARNNGL